MTPVLQQLLSEIEAFGQANDASIHERPRRMLNITRGTGDFLAHVVKAMGARELLEIGTSNGYSTLWLADAAGPSGGKVTTIEMSPFKLAMAQQNFSASGLGGYIAQREGDAGKIMADTADAAFDLVFLDSERSEYLGWWPDLKRILRPDGLLVVDNATSHAGEMAPFMRMVADDGGFATALVEVGNGEFMASRDRAMGRHWADWREPV